STPTAGCLLYGAAEASFDQAQLGFPREPRRRRVVAPVVDERDFHAEVAAGLGEGTRIARNTGSQREHGKPLAVTLEHERRSVGRRRRLRWERVCRAGDSGPSDLAVEASLALDESRARPVNRAPRPAGDRRDGDGQLDCLLGAERRIEDGAVLQLDSVGKYPRAGDEHGVGPTERDVVPDGQGSRAKRA